MRSDLDRVTPGMAVFTIDGQRLGEVAELRRPALTADQLADHLVEQGFQFEPGAPPFAAEGRLQPLGTTTPKGRGGETDAGIAAQRGDQHTVAAGDASALPGVGGRDLLRGYSPEPGGAAASGALADWPPDAPSTGGKPAAPSAGERAEAPPEPTLVVQTPGTLGVVSRRLHIPIDQIGVIDPGHALTLVCSKDEAIDRYGGLPGLVIDPDAPVKPY